MAEGGGFFKTASQLDRPDIQLHFVIGIVDDHMRKMHFSHGYSCHVCVLRPESRGEVGLTSSDPLAPPRIDPNYLGDPADLATLKKGARMMEKIMQAEALSPWRGEQLYAHNGSDAALEADIRARALIPFITRSEPAGWGVMRMLFAIFRAVLTGSRGFVWLMHP